MLTELEMEAGPFLHSHLPKQNTHPGHTIRVLDRLWQPVPVDQAEWNVPLKAVGPLNPIFQYPCLELNSLVVEHHAALLADRKPVEPLLVLYVGGVLILADGYHRLAAYRRVQTATAVPVCLSDIRPSRTALKALEINTAKMTEPQCLEAVWRMLKMDLECPLPIYSNQELKHAGRVSTSAVQSMITAYTSLKNELSCTEKASISWQQAQVLAASTERSS